MRVSLTQKMSLGKYSSQAFINWLISSDGQNVIRSYKIDGPQLFFGSLIWLEAAKPVLGTEEVSGQDIEHGHMLNLIRSVC